MDLFDIHYIREQTEKLSEDDLKTIEFSKEKNNFYWKCKKCNKKHTFVNCKKIEDHLEHHKKTPKSNPVRLGGISKEAFLKMTAANFIESHGFTTVSKEETAKDFEKLFEGKIEFDN